MSELSSLEAGSSTFNRRNVEIGAILEETIAALPQVPDREIAVELSGGEPATVSADPVRLRSALTSILNALQRELVTSNRLHVRWVAREQDGRAVVWIAFGDRDQADRLGSAKPSDLTGFDEWRGGCGLSLAIARRVIGAHDGTVWSAGDNAKAGAVVMLPRADAN
jgi:signal transduction histidine kinase